jgi:hypothetical protein
MSDRPRTQPEGYQPNAIERASLPLLIRLSAMPPWLLMVVLAALLVVGLALHNPIGGVILLGLAGFVTCIAAAGWSQQIVLVRILRGGVVAVLLLAAGAEFFA